jgi:phosphatidylglycerophosphate synthase
VQALIAIPDIKTLNQYGGPAEALLRQIAGVPLLARVIKTAIRAGIDSVLVIWPSDVPQSVWFLAQAQLAAEKLCGLVIVHQGPFEPRQKANWEALSGFLDDQFLWLPWNWVTNKRELASLKASPAVPADWSIPIQLTKAAVENPKVLYILLQRDGIAVTSAQAAAEAERYVVARSGKALDGMYSTFNRWLCRPVVRLLSHTSVTPNAVTLAGLVAATLSCFAFARGFYAAYVCGALLFFLSGLFDEMDGMLARIKFRESAFGTWFEGFVDNATYLFVFAGITIGLYRQHRHTELVWGMALIAGSVLSVVLINLQRRRSTDAARPNEYLGNMYAKLDSDSSNFVSFAARHLNVFLKKAAAIHYLLLFTLFGGLTLFLWLAAIGANLTWILTIYFNRRFFRRPSVVINTEIPTAA